MNFDIDFTNAASKFVNQYHVDEENKEVIDLLRLYFTSSELFENDSNFPHFSLLKGLCMKGNFGSGKTLLFKIFQRMFKGEFSLLQCGQVAKDYGVNGFEALDKYLERKHICFDELGVESRQKYYGQEENTMAIILSSRYELFRDHGVKTHITTNLTGDQIKEYYGERVYSRITEMCNVLVLGGNVNSKDRRKDAVPVAKPDINQKEREADARHVYLTPGMIEERQENNYMGLAAWVKKNGALPYVWGWADVYQHMKKNELFQINEDEIEMFRENIRAKLDAEIERKKEGSYLQYHKSKNDLEKDVELELGEEMVKSHFQIQLGNGNHILKQV